MDSMEWVQASMYGWSWLWTVPVTGPLDGRCAVVVCALNYAAQ
ncbi:hypothetical protein ABZ883_10470 [Streptomyces sp. NPDC046977]